MRRFLKPIIVLLSTVALFVASTSSVACMFWSLREPKMPESLIKKN